MDVEMEGFEVVLWAAIFVFGLVLAFIQMHHLMNISELEIDHLNPIEFCEKINCTIKPEIIALAGLTLLLLFVDRIAFGIHLLVLLYSIYEQVKRPTEFDSTTVFKKIKPFQIRSTIKLIFHISFCIYFMVWFVMGLVGLLVNARKKPKAV
eukprot:TRINITY_DN6296_c0_g1::TRINITY_DN6296_c0_g1_i1::g.186::m.186 TRINITY_DN6296_c0_g1::TRINITY_DN6296_c0_g1_i1::g.186  ORF type:complete len:165 (-),score=12.47,sp/P53173/ERV14_YEAST/30.43/1e-10,Cornichon/PF03311.9/3.1e-21,PepSY_TM_3/PF13706.1/3.8e+03,PepSY_TM_3/PF13706.1/9.4,PepSY_TM_3/PF13706.1/6.3e+03,PepSY_TM_3/PF13706.1/0.041,DUF1218/PF06749.7/1.5e+02,DUF1218/PF06749.7/1.4e+03,DUF1218/PF06749.7/1.5 TRINITY_DN6296_c0_g1_i1:566-1018(-)